MSTTVTIPHQLIQEISKGNVILFLGSGASHGAIHPKGAHIPLGNQLRNMLVERFLDKSYETSSLAYVADICISENDLFTVQNYIKEVFNDFLPAPYHNLICQFKWKSIFTTNYDLIIEKVYENNSNRLQALNPIVQNGPIERIISNSDVLPYFKLHGCIRYATDKDLPLVLTMDQYAAVQYKRNRLFGKLEELASDYTFLFVGYSNSDSDIREILKRIDYLNDAKPRSYFISPDIRPAEEKMYANKKITTMSVSFKDFLEQLNIDISPTNRKLSSLVSTDFSLPIYRKFVNDPKKQSVSSDFVSFITKSVDYVTASLPSEHVNPKDFYKGYFVNWDPIIKNLDVERTITDKIVLKVFLDETITNSISQEFYLLKGNAGSGKSVLLKRLAWTAGVDYDKLCLFYKPNSYIKYDDLYEVYLLCKERLFVFIDDAINQSDSIGFIMSQSKKDNVPITIFGCARNNEYNLDGDELLKYLTDSFELTYLKDKEIRGLLALLERYKSLGYLENKPFDVQVDAFSKKSARELLVALYEATEGKPFAEIIADEYNKIPSQQAKSLYLTVSILHRLGCKARAGFISRTHKITFTSFKEKLFAPLANIIFDNYNPSITDYEYGTRHQQIAEMIFSNILKEKQDRYDEYLRVISFLDIDYENDRNAFKAMTNAKQLYQIFRDVTMIRELYKVASSRSVNDPFLLQQMGIFEMAYGDSNAAHSLLTKASSFGKNNLYINHSLAEYELKLAENASQPLKRNMHLEKAILICNKALKKEPTRSSFYHTLIKISLLKITELFNTDDYVMLEREIKDAQKILTLSLANCGEQQFLLDAESKFHQLLKDSPAALISIEKAFSVNKRNPYIAMRLSKFYENSGRIDDAIRVLTESLAFDNFNKDMNYKLGLLFLKLNPPNKIDALYHLKRSFIEGDTNYPFQFEYACALFANNQFDEAKGIFENLKDADMSPKLKKTVKNLYISNDKLTFFEGSVASVNYDNCTVRMDQNGIVVFMWINEDFHIRVGDRLIFNLGFNYYGPIAINPEKV